MPDSEPVRLLLLTDSPQQPALLNTLLTFCQGDVVVVRDLAEGSRHLHRSTFQLIVLEEALVHVDSAELDALYQAANGAMVLAINFAISDPSRILRQVRWALASQSRYAEQARQAALCRIRDELSAPVSGLLLQTQLLAGHAGPLPSSALQELAELAESLRVRLRLEAELIPR